MSFRPSNIYQQRLSMTYTKAIFTVSILFIACTALSCRKSDISSVNSETKSVPLETEEIDIDTPTFEWSSNPPEIVGTDRFKKQVEGALELLQLNSPNAYHVVQTYVGVIQQGEKSGMRASLNPPKFEMADSTTFHSCLLYTSPSPRD